MYNALTSGAGLPSNLQTFHERAGGSHFGGAPAAAFNPGPRSGAGMSIFSSTPAGELMSSASDDSLFSPAVAPVTRAYAVVSGIESAKDHAWMPKGTVVQISDFVPSDTLQQDSKATKKAERAGHTLKRLLCPHCIASSVTPYADADGVVGVLAEAVDIGKKARNLHGGFITITVAIENAAEVYVPPSETEDGMAFVGDTVGWTDKLKEKVPSQTITLQARKDLGRFRVATVLSPWHLGDAVGIHACLHPQIFVTQPSKDKISDDGPRTAQRDHTQAAMRLDDDY